MARLVVALDNHHQNEAVIGEDWITVWPTDFTFIRFLDDEGPLPPAPQPPAPVEETTAPEPQQVSQPVASPEPPTQNTRDRSETGSLLLPARHYGN